MTIPSLLPQIEPTSIPDSLVFIAITMRDPNLPVAIMHFDTKRRNSSDDPGYEWPATAENVEAEIAKAGFDVVSWRVIQYEDIPKDRTYRDAWKDEGKTIEHDMMKAKEIHRQHIRYARAAKLAELDLAYQRADEEDNTSIKRVIADQKQVLRDLPAHPMIEEATTIDELKTFWPENLR